MIMANQFYVYVYTDPRKPGLWEYGTLKFDFEPYYVGKGKGARYKRHVEQYQINSGNNPHKERKLKKIIGLGYDPTEFVVFVSPTDCESLAHQTEIDLIKKIGRHNLGTGPLCNLTDGGEGMANYQSPLKGKKYEEFLGEQKAALLKKQKSEMFSGSKNPMFGKSCTGRKMSEEAKLNLSVKKSQPVVQLCLASGTIIGKFRSPKEASQKLGIKLSGIHNCLSPNQPSRSSGGFRWEYQSQKKDS
jgi:hypothetical protein